MNNNHISNIRRKDLILLIGQMKYYRIDVYDNYDNKNFRLLLEFIGNNFDYGRNNDGNAYRAICIEANKLLGCWRGAPKNLKVSKKEIKTISSTITNNRGKVCLKIPYKISYIFKAIINIVEKIKSDKNIKLPKELKHVYNLTYGIAFYSEHICQYKGKYQEILDHDKDEPGHKLKKELHNDFESYNSVFYSIFK